MNAGSGQKRIFTSPALESGYSYSYRVTASWMDNGQEVRLERVVPVAPGRISNVDFTRVNTVEPMPAAQVTLTVYFQASVAAWAATRSSEEFSFHQFSSIHQSNTRHRPESAEASSWFRDDIKILGDPSAG